MVYQPLRIRNRQYVDPLVKSGMEKVSKWNGSKDRIWDKRTSNLNFY